MNVEEADKKINNANACFFERAIFLSWFCSKADCKFCFMSTQKDKIRLKNPRLARRRLSSILAEVIITEACGWKIEFLSGGYESYTTEEMHNVIQKIHHIYDEQLWLNIGVLSKDELLLFKPYTKGITGAVETINPELHGQLCPSKPIKEIEKMFDICEQLDLKKSITIIIGLGETLEDFELLKRFIQKHNLARITFYALNPHKGTIFEKGPDSRYYAQWIEKTRQILPKIEIIAGSWTNRIDEIPLLLAAGADSITKLPVIKIFNTKYSRDVEKKIQNAGRTFNGTLSCIPEKEINNILQETNYEIELKNKIREKVKIYIRRMKRNGLQKK